MAYILSPMAVPLALRRAVEQAHHAYHPEAGLHSECSCIICNCTAPPVVHRGSRKSGLSSFCREQSVCHPEATTVHAVETGCARWGSRECLTGWKGFKRVFDGSAFEQVAAAFCI